MSCASIDGNKVFVSFRFNHGIQNERIMGEILFDLGAFRRICACSNLLYALLTKPHQQDVEFLSKIEQKTWKASHIKNPRVLNLKIAFDYV